MKIKPELVDNRSGKRFRIFKNPTFLGRHRSCEICIPIVEISRRHLKIVEENEVYFIEDLQSVNGTFVNEEPVSGRRQLRDGYHVKVAKCAKYPAGAKDFIFRHPQPKVEPKDEVTEALTESEQRDIRGILPKVQIPLKHCVFRVGKKGMLGGGESKVRVPLQKMGGKEIHFLSMVAYRPGEGLSLTIEHPKIEPPIAIALKVARVLAIKGDGMQIYRIDCQIAKFPPKELERFKKAIQVTPLVKYNFLRQSEKPAGGGEA